MSTVEVYYDESLPIHMDGEPRILLHYVSARRKGRVYVQPIGALTLKSMGIRTGSCPMDQLPYKTHKIDRELLPLLPSWVSIEMGKRWNDAGTFR